MCNRIFFRRPVRSQRQPLNLERHRQQPREHQHGRLQGQHGDVRGPGQPDVGGTERQPDADRPRRHHRRRSRPNFTQGGIENTRRADQRRDPGHGFFVVGDATATSYTRAGNFSFDATAARHAGRSSRAGLHRDSIRHRQDRHDRRSPTDIIVPPGVLRAAGADDAFATVSNLDAAPPSATRSRVGADVSTRSARRTS